MPRKKQSALPPGFFERVAALRRRISAGIQQGFGVVRDLDLTLAQALALFHLGEVGPASVTELMAVVGRSQSSTSALVDQLEARGFVTREPSATDRRRRDVRLTDRGHEVVDQVEAARREGLERALAGV
ncbi:MAG: MarR family transcriptional regulator, partial [Sandaracinaceae bacterium]|nr:MarR family transcriptional regulator [Sandaracinaceae bacterium]